MSSEQDPAPDLPASGEVKGESDPSSPPRLDAKDSTAYQNHLRLKIFLVLLTIRIVNAICVRTFFQPDEYFQSLEPAWQMVFGSESGAWITWEWHHQLRTSLHPALFAGAYYLADKVLNLLSVAPSLVAFCLGGLPNIIQAVFAAAGDYYTWQLADKIYGRESNVGFGTLVLTILSPWQWFCSTRTFSNSIETTLTIAALNFWPWEISTDSASTIEANEGTPTAQMNTLQASNSVAQLRISLFLAAMTCILRPTNLLVWTAILMPVATRFFSRFAGAGFAPDHRVLVREAVLCGVLALLISGASDRLYFGEWTFPPYQWFTFNVNKDLAVFYGRNDWHYYISQGLPLLLTTYIPFTFIALVKSDSLPTTDVRYHLNTAVFLTIGTLSTIAHKEVRFIYPLLPLLHIVTAPTFINFFTSSTTTHREWSLPTRRKPLFVGLLCLNALIAYFTTIEHQQGVIEIMPYLRKQYEIENGYMPVSADVTSATSTNETFAAFLMPCHSTPWRSQLYYPGLHAWALTCEPPIHLPARSEEREAYRDEADRFYDDPSKFLKEEVGTADKPWPKYLVGFEGIEEYLKNFCEEKKNGLVVREKWRTRNSIWHDDSRRQGDVVVWELV